MSLFRRRQRVPIYNPYDEAMTLAREGDWRGLRFLDASEQLAEIESALCDTFKAGTENKLGSAVPFLNIVDRIQELYEHRSDYQGSDTAQEDS